MTSVTSLQLLRQLKPQVGEIALRDEEKVNDREEGKVVWQFSNIIVLAGLPAEFGFSEVAEQSDHDEASWQPVVRTIL